MAEKKELLEARFSVRREAEKQKRDLMEKVEKLKKKGDFSKDKLAELGLVDLRDTSPIDRITQRSIEAHDVSEDEDEEARKKIINVRENPDDKSNEYTPEKFGDVNDNTKSPAK
jgi:hypothetical protein